MRYEYIVQKENYKAKIYIEISNYNYSSISYRMTTLEVLPKGKRKWIAIGGSIGDDYSYRELDFDGRSEYAKERYLKYVTWEDICDAVDYAYKQIKPDYSKIDFRAV